MKTPSQSEERNDPSAPGNGDAYLWDRTGPVDPEIEKLESLLAGSGLQRMEREASDPSRVLGGARLFRPSRLLPLAALIALVLGVGAWYTLRETVPADGWSVAATTGAPRANRRAIGAGQVLGLGEWLVTDAGSTATVRVPRIGTVGVSPNSRLRIEHTSDDKHEINLAHGTIAATINAPERIFFVQTRAALATDMGCKYDLTMPETGPGLLTVTLGWVLLEGHSRNGKSWEARVPRDVSCVIYDDIGPGTPFSVTATAVRDLLAPYDASEWDAISAQQLDALLAACDGDDLVTLWHLLYRVNEPLRAAVFDRLSALVVLPADVKKEDVVKLDADVMEKIWPRVKWN